MVGKNGKTEKQVKHAGKKVPAETDRKSRVIKLAENSHAAGNINCLAEDVIFAMDIGTRKVAGVAGIQEGECFRVLATEVCEHRQRAMYDGQVHDIEQVAIAASEVKRKLESRLGLKLKKVAIAAAGRVLKTCRVRVEKELEPGKEINDDMIAGMEMEGVQQAQMVLDEEECSENNTPFYCVGYSIVNYYLNGFVISKLTGHRGRTMGADVLATFLPMIVVDSLYAVMNKIGLEVSSLTLEPIAALNAAIPADLRLLNLALVDIGAGTSDIALTKDGSIIAYSMVPIAGDEITEKISQDFLVDFNTGEKIKIALSSGKEIIEFTDILKKKRSVKAAEVMKSIGGCIKLLASTISQKILEYNGKSPNAVFLVGGGSRIPQLPGLLAQQLGIPEERVAVRGRDVIRNIKFSDKRLFGPESITPYGIAVNASSTAGKDFLSISVNDRKLRLFNSKNLTVADALILYGFDACQLIGRSGKGLSFYVNGEIKHVRGEYGKAAEIHLNGKPSSLDTPVSYGDIITVIPAVNGRDAVVKAGDVIGDYFTGMVRLNGNPVDIGTDIYINGRKAKKDTPVIDGDRISTSRIRTLKDLLEAGGIDAGVSQIIVNGNHCEDPDYILKNGDEILCVARKDTPALKNVGLLDAVVSRDGSSVGKDDGKSPGIEEDDANYTENTEEAVTHPDISANEPVNMKSKAIEKPDAAFGFKISDGRPHVDISAAKSENGIEVTVNGRNITLKGKKSQYIFVDIFNYINFDLSRPQGTITLKLNGRPAAFTDILQGGDIIEIFWEKAANT